MWKIKATKNRYIREETKSKKKQHYESSECDYLRASTWSRVSAVCEIKCDKFGLVGWVQNNDDRTVEGSL